MVESQVRPSDVTDRRVLRAMGELQREAFVPERLRPVCYMDQDIVLPAAAPGATERFLLAPRLQAKLVQALQLSEAAKVLDLGCASGYSTALIAAIAHRVIAIEHDPHQAAFARDALAKLEIANAEVRAGDLAAGASEEAPFDAILINGAVDEVPETLLDQLKDGGRLIAVKTGQGTGRATEWLRVGGSFATAPLFDAASPLLSPFRKEPSFSF